VTRVSCYGDCGLTVAREKSQPNSEPDGLTRSPRRHSGGARHEASERVLLRAYGVETHGWTLNVSRGGVRAIVEDALSQGVEYEIVVGDEAAVPPRRARVVWLQDESDGQIVGLEYLDGEDGSAPPKDG
jgi:PilZ domain